MNDTTTETTAPAVNLIPATVTSGNATGSTTQKVLVDPATGTHYCSDCDYTHPNFASVRAHRRAHAAPKRPIAPAEQTVAQKIESLLAVAQELREATEVKPDKTKVDASWKDRALKAERRLATLRRALGGAA